MNPTDPNPHRRKAFNGRWKKIPKEQVATTANGRGPDEPSKNRKQPPVVPWMQHPTKPPGR